MKTTGKSDFDPFHQETVLEQLYSLRRDILRRIHGAKLRKDWNARKAANAELRNVEDQIAFEKVSASRGAPVSRFYAHFR